MHATPRPKKVHMGTNDQFATARLDLAWGNGDDTRATSHVPLDGAERCIAAHYSTLRVQAAVVLWSEKGRCVIGSRD